MLQVYVLFDTVEKKSYGSHFIKYSLKVKRPISSYLIEYGAHELSYVI